MKKLLFTDKRIWTGLMCPELGQCLVSITLGLAASKLRLYNNHLVCGKDKVFLIKGQREFFFIPNFWAWADILG